MKQICKILKFAADRDYDAAYPLQQERSCIKHIMDRKMKQHDRLLVIWLMDIKLKVKEEIHSTFSRTKLEVTWMVPMCVTTTLSPLGNWTKEVTELVILVNKATEWTIWSVALVSSTQVS